MKQTRALLCGSIMALLTSSLIALTVMGKPAHVGEGFSVKEYEDFHHVLHELQHEALPRKDFARLRSRSADLVKLGDAIVQLGVPQGTATANVAEFEKELKKFRAALLKFSADAKAGDDDQLRTSFSAVHDSFESLADMLPRKS